MARPSCFISYSWESNEHNSWVRTLAERLVGKGIQTSLDQWDLRLGADVPDYMETCIRESDFVVLVCTPTFAAKANAGEGGVGYEKRIVTGEIYQGADSPDKFIPLLRKGNREESLPSYLKSKYYTDFRQDEDLNSQLEELVRHMYRSPRYTRPPLGPQPTFSAQDDGGLTQGAKMFCSQCGLSAGTRAPCIGLSLSHDFRMYEGLVYCNRCGVAPGQRTVCTGFSTYHDFGKYRGPVYCSRCGVAPSQRTVCTGFDTYHDFRVYSGPAVYCTVCGVAAGRQTTCTGWNTYHDFVSK